MRQASTLSSSVSNLLKREVFLLICPFCRKMFVGCALSCEFFIQFLYFSEGLTTPGLYRTGGVNSKVQRLMTSVFGKNLYTHLSIIIWLHNNN